MLIYDAVVTPRTARLLAIPFALLACLLLLAVRSWVHPHLSVGLSLAVFGVAYLVQLGLPFGGYLLLTRRFRKGPATWGPEFSAGPSPQMTGTIVIMVGWQVGNAIDFAQDLREDPVLVTVGLVFAVVLLVCAVLLAVTDRPRLDLTPAGLTFRGLIRRRSATWDEPFLIPAHRLFIDRDFLNFTRSYYRHAWTRRDEIGTEAGARAVEEAFRQR